MLFRSIALIKEEKSDQESLWVSLRASLGDSLRASLWDSLRASLRDSLWDSLGASAWDSLTPEWVCCWAAMFEFSSQIGVSFDQNKYDLFLNYCKEVGWIFPFENIVIACERPTVRWNDAGEIHSENSPAIEFKDFSVWAIDGIRVPEKIVLAPESQTIEEIQSEDNEEVRRIRISRYGWTNYLREIGGSIVDTQQAPGGWMEALIKTTNYAVLCTYDPSTGRPYALEVSLDCDSCESAQRYLYAPDIAFEGLGLKVPGAIETYPVVRT